MLGAAIDTVRLHCLFDRMQAGDTAAREELFHGYYTRLEKLARQMLRRYPGLRQWEDTGDVLHPALLRLMRALEHVRPDSTRAFLGLAALQIRRRLLNLAKRHKNENALSTRDCDGARASICLTSIASPTNPADLEKWTAFHRGVEELPDDEREVINLLYYHGLSKEHAAELIGTSPRTVRRRWRSALIRLHGVVNQEA